MVEATVATGRALLDVLGQAGRLVLVGARGTLRLARSAFPGERFRAQATVTQAYLMGSTAVPIVALISLMMGAILAFQSAYQLKKLGAETLVANLVAVALTRELGPVITAIVVAGRSGSAIAAEIASMKVQEEIDALRVMGINPLAFLVAPRLLALLIVLPLLTAMADLVGILGGMLCASVTLDIPVHQYLSNCQEAVVMRDFVTGLVKAVVFAGLIATVGAFCGLEVEGGAEGVGKATTRSVVLSIFLVIVADLVFTGLFFNTA